MKSIRQKLVVATTTSLISLGVSLPAYSVGLTLDTTLTADNHYKAVVGNDSGSQLKLIGRNEFGPFNVPDTTPPVPDEACPDDAPFSWSCPEAFTTSVPSRVVFNDGVNDYLYIYSFVWGEESVRRAFLGEFEVTGCDCEDNILFSESFVTDPQWDVAVVEDFNPGTFGDVSLGQISTEILDANANNAWISATSKGFNVDTTLPWKRIPGITSSAEFIATDTPGDDEDSLLFRRRVLVPVDIPPCTPEPSMLISLGVTAGLSLLAKRRLSQIK